MTTPSPNHGGPMSSQMKPWPLCDFCFSDRVEWSHPCETFSIAALEYQSNGMWAACDACHEIIERGEIELLIDRAMQMDVVQSSPREYDPTFRSMIKLTYKLFLAKRTGPAYRCAV